VGGGFLPDIDASPNVTLLGRVGTVAATWRLFTASFSGTARYEVCVGTTSGGCDLTAGGPVFLDSTATSYAGTFLLPSLTSTAFTTVTAVSNSGLRTSVTSDGLSFDPYAPVVSGLAYAIGSPSSAGPILDPTAPVPSPAADSITTVYVRVPPSLTGSNGRLAIILPSVVTGSAPIANVLVSVGSTPGASNIARAVNLGPRTAGTLSAVTIAEGTRYCASATVISATGLVAQVQPTACAVYDGSAPPAATLTASATPLQALPGNAGSRGVNVSLCFTAFGDAHSGVSNTTLSFGDSAFGVVMPPVVVPVLSNLLPFAPAARCVWAALPDYTPQRGVPQIATVTVYNGAGLSRVFIAAPFTVDHEAPLPPLIGSVSAGAAAASSSSSAYDVLTVDPAVICSDVGAGKVNGRDCSTISVFFALAGSATAGPAPPRMNATSSDATVSSVNGTELSNSTTSNSTTSNSTTSNSTTSNSTVSSAPSSVVYLSTPTEFWGGLGSRPGLADLLPWRRLSPIRAMAATPSGAVVIAGYRAELTGVAVPPASRTYVSIMAISQEAARRVAGGALLPSTLAAEALVSTTTAGPATSASASLSTAATVLLRDDLPPSFPFAPYLLPTSAGGSGLVAGSHSAALTDFSTITAAWPAARTQEGGEIAFYEVALVASPSNLTVVPFTFAGLRTAWTFRNVPDVVALLGNLTDGRVAPRVRVWTTTNLTATATGPFSSYDAVPPSINGPVILLGWVDAPSSLPNPTNASNPATWRSIPYLLPRGPTGILTRADPLTGLAPSSVALALHGAADNIDGSGVTGYEVALGTTPGGGELLPFTHTTPEPTNPNDDAGVVRVRVHNVALSHGVPVYASVRITDAAGNSAIRSAATPSVALVQAPNPAGFAVRLASPFVGHAAQTLRVFFSAPGGLLPSAALAISEAVDASIPTGLAKFRVAFARDEPTDAGVALTGAPGWVDVSAADAAALGSATDEFAADVSGFRFLDNTRYFVLVEAVARSGLATRVASASPFIVDLTPPTVADRSLVRSPRGSSSRTDLAVSWRGGFVDTVSGIASYEVQLHNASTRTSIGEPVSARLTAGPDASVVFRDLNLQHRGRYALSVRACSRAGLCTDMAADVGFVTTVDLTPPTIRGVVAVSGPRPNVTSAFVTDASIPTRAFLYAADCTKFVVTWGTLVDVESGIVGLTVALGSTPFGQELAAARAVPNPATATSFLIQGPTIRAEPGMPVYATIVATNAAGGVTRSTASSATVCASTDPFTFNVYDGIVPDDSSAGDPSYDVVAYQSPFLQGGCHWSSTSAPVAGLNHYVVGVGSAPGRDDVVAFRSTGTVRRITFSMRSFASRRYFCTVHAVSRAGRTRVQSSTGASIDRSAPIIVAESNLRLVVRGKPSVTSWQSDRTKLNFCYDRVFIEREGAVVGFEVGVYSAKAYAAYLTLVAAGRGNNPQPDIIAWQRRPDPTPCTVIDELNLADSSAYILVVRAQNLHGLISMPAGRAFGIDSTGPAVRDGLSAFNDAVAAYQDERSARGLPKYGYLADGSLPLSLPDHVRNGAAAAASAAAAAASSSDVPATTITLPANFSWRPLITANIPYTERVYSADGMTCPITARALEVPGFSGVSSLIGAYETASSGGMIPLNSDAQVGGNHTSMCGVGAFRTPFGVCAACPLGTFKSEAGDGPCSVCSRGTFWSTAAQQANSMRVASEPLYTLATTDASARASCACLDYNTQEFDPASGQCVCKAGFQPPSAYVSAAGTLAGQRAPEPPRGAVDAALEAGICTVCGEGSAKPAGNVACTVCPEGTAPNDDFSECACNDALSVWKADTGKCECRPGLVRGPGGQCERCPGRAQVKYGVGDSPSLCVRCRAGTEPEPEAGATCVTSIPRAEMDLLGEGTGAFCPAGTVHKFLGHRTEKVGGVVLTYHDFIYQIPDVSRPGHVVCLPSTDDMETGNLAVELPRVREGTNTPIEPLHLLEPETGTIVANTRTGAFWRWDYGTKHEDKRQRTIYTPPDDASTALKFVLSLREPGSTLHAIGVDYVKLVMGTSNDFSLEAHTDFWDTRIYEFVEASKTPDTINLLIGRYFDYRPFMGDAGAYEENVTPVLQLAQAYLVSFAESYASYRQGLFERLIVPDTYPALLYWYVNDISFVRRDWAVAYEAVLILRDRIDNPGEGMTTDIKFFSGVNANQRPGLYKISYAGPNSWCSYTRTVPIHTCVPCDDGLIQPYPIPIADFARIDQRDADRRVDDGVCTACPVPVASVAAVQSSSYNFFAVPHVDALYIDWSGVFTKDVGIGNVTYSYALGTSPGGRQIIPPTPHGAGLKVVIPGPASRLGLQPGTPIYATIIATDALSNPTVWADQNPVVWEPTGPIGGAAKDATLDDYAPPLPAEIVAALESLARSKSANATVAADNANAPVDSAGRRRLLGAPAGGRGLTAFESRVESHVPSVPGLRRPARSLFKVVPSESNVGVGVPHWGVEGGVRHSRRRPGLPTRPSIVQRLARVHTTEDDHQAYLAELEEELALDDEVVETAAPRFAAADSADSGEKRALALPGDQASSAPPLEGAPSSTPLAGSLPLWRARRGGANGPLARAISAADTEVALIAAAHAALVSGVRRRSLELGQSAAPTATMSTVALAAARNGGASDGSSRSSSGRRRNLQYGEYPSAAVSAVTSSATDTATDTASVTASAASSLASAYDWRIDSTLVDITFVPDRAFQTTCDSLNITFEAFDGVITGVTRLYACAGSAPGWCDLADPVILSDQTGGGADAASSSLATATTVSLANLALPRGVVVYGTVFAVSGAGTVATVSTDGIACEDRPPSSANAAVLDVGRYYSAPPSFPGSGRAGRGVVRAYDVDCDASGSGVGAAWSGFAFYYPPSRFEWAAGTTPGGDDIVPWTTVGLTTSAYDETAAAEPGTVIYASVRAYDAAGRFAEAQSDGVLLLPPGAAGDDGFVCHTSPATVAGLAAGAGADGDALMGVAGLGVLVGAEAV
jgi:hypothetical protein